MVAVRQGLDGQEWGDGSGTQSLIESRTAGLWPRIEAWARELGFSQVGVSGVDLSTAEPGLLAWIEAGHHGSMHYMSRHGTLRARPAELVPGTLRVITVRMDYLPRQGALGGAADAPGLSVAPATSDASSSSGASVEASETPETLRADPFAQTGDWSSAEWHRIRSPAQATVSIYARGRDYHKVLRSRLQTLAERIESAIGPFGHRVYTDSAPLLEVELASRSGIGWRGKHTLALNRDGGSMFFLGEICVDLPVPLTAPVDAHCGSCSACIDLCPTQAIVAPYRLDARRCISYLTIEHAGPIPVEFRAPMGNRIYGCDDCQLVCPWNKYARRSTLPDFDVRGVFDQPTLLELWSWSEADFLRHTEGSAIRRIGHERWRRNLAVALGNALHDEPDADVRLEVRQALAASLDEATPLVREHIEWALSQDTSVRASTQPSAVDAP